MSTESPQPLYSGQHIVAPIENLRELIYDRITWRWKDAGFNEVDGLTELIHGLILEHVAGIEAKDQQIIDSLRRSLKNAEHAADTYKRALTAVKEERDTFSRELTVTRKALNIRREMTPRWSFRIWKLVIGWGRK